MSIAFAGVATVRHVSFVSSVRRKGFYIASLDLARMCVGGLAVTLCVVGSARDTTAASPPPPATVVIVANRTPQIVEFQVAATDGTTITRKLAPLDYVAVPVTGVVPIEFQVEAEKRRYGLAPPGIYCFVSTADKRIDLTRIDLRLPDAARSDMEVASGGVDRTKLDQVAVIPVKILVDDNEMTRRESWEPRLRKRLEAANEILAAGAGARLKITAVETWQSDNKVTDFELSLKEFERAVQPGTASLAIGFTSQYPVRQGRQKLGGTRAPLYPYILLREYGPRINERERLELLVHELGHFLGAAHSPEANSVMRPVLGDDQVNLRQFRILLDPLNALAVNLMTQQWRDRNVRALYQIDSGTRSTLSDVYRVLADADRGDPAAAQYLRILEETDFSTTARGAALVVEGIRGADSKPPVAGENEFSDQRADRYIRAAAAAALRLPSESVVDSFLLGTAIAMGERPLPTILAVKQALPLLSARPTVQGEEILLKRFVTAAALARIGGSAAVEAAALARQVNQMRSGGSFSFAELTAELAGIRFASALEAGAIRVPTIAREFTMAQHLLPRQDDQAGLSVAEFARRYGSIYDPRFQKELERLRREVNNLPRYRSRG